MSYRICFYVTPRPTQPSISPGIGKSSTGLAGVNAGCVHLCLMVGNTV